MKKRYVGTSDLLVSEVGLGCMSLGTDVEKAKSIIDEALELGVNYLDTADLYDRGLNEEIVGRAIKHTRSNVILATKVGNRWMDGEERWSWDPSKKYIKEAVKKSLNRLQTDYIDLYQLHGGTMEDPIDETIEAFEELKAEGIIRYYGISSIRPNVIKEYVAKSSIVSVMMQYSILDRRPEEEILDYLAEHSVSVMARGPLAKGVLTDSWASKTPENGYLQFTEGDLTKSITTLKDALPERSFQEYALHYCLDHKAVAAVIPGASSISQIRENVRAVESQSITKQEIEIIQSNFPAQVYQQHR
ncbi:aldo/keto reductase [Bacillus pinisoli]|uniref:aldo/keto reductase n=1 Tax=Bacillus pinisoli TaxID=2901866 RepID=UPI001FF54B70|nr:aldo/keto reductase [Bacillus pinisoli]